MKNNKIPDSILVLFLTAYSYLISYLYSAGQYSYFNLPIFLVEVTLENIITSIFSIIIFILVIYIILNVFTQMIPNDLNIQIVKLIRKHLFLSSYCIVVIIFFWSSFGNIKPDKKLLLFIGILMLILVAFDFIKPIFSQKDIKGYQNKLIAEIEKNVQNDTDYEYKHSIGNLVSKHVPFILPLIFLGFLSASLAYNLGIYGAHKQEVFTVINGEMIVLGSYQKRFIVKTIDSKENSLSDDFSMISTQDNYKFSKKKINSLIIK